jgi:O-antigen/teichoic acid export membrane protein
MLLWTNLQGTLGMVSGRLATVLVGAMLGPVAAGLYLVAYQVAAVIERPLQIVRRAVDPEFARLVAAADMATLWRLFRRTLLGTACFAAPLLVVLGLFGDRLLGFFFGEAFAAAHPVLVLLALQTALLALVMPSASVLVMLGHAGRLLLAQAIGRGAQLLALLALMQHFGLVAAGAAGAAAAGLELVLVTGFVLATRRAAAPDAATAAGGCAGR